MPAVEARSRRSYLEVAIEAPAVIVLVAMMLHVTANALMRTYANQPLPNTLEYVQYWYLPVVALLGFVAAQLRGQHIAADLLFERLPGVTQPFVLCGVSLLCAAVCAAFAWFGWAEAMNAFETRRTAGVSTVPAWPPYFLVPFVFASLTVQFGMAGLRSLSGVDSQLPVGDPDDALILEELASVNGGKS